MSKVASTVFEVRKEFESPATVKFERLWYPGILDQPKAIKVEIDRMQNVVLLARTMPYDSEVSFGVVDADGELVRELRTDIWAKHMEHTDPRELDDITGAIDAFERSARNESG